MPLDNNLQYYMVVDEQSTGPFTLDEVTLHPKLTPETLVWKPGLDNWVAAKTLPELAPAFVSSQETCQQAPPDYNQNREHSSGHPDYNNTNNYGPRQNEEGNPFANNPQYRADHTYKENQYNPHNPYDNQRQYNYQNRYDNRNGYYDRRDQYQNGYRPSFRTNWLPWAIVATVFGFFTSCIGAIFGIIGIVQANKANTFYAQGYDREGDAANSNARIMTIIGLVFAGLGIIFAFTFGNYFANFARF